MIEEVFEMRILSLCLIALLLLLPGAVFAEGGDRVGDETYAMEDGYIRLPFGNGYYGFCIAYGTPEADKDDIYTVYDTSAAINWNTGAGIGNKLKVMATQYPEILMWDDIVAQHYIWHFSDEFSGWRVDPEQVEDIKRTSEMMTIPDHGYQTEKDGVIQTWDFIVLDEKDGDALFFAYKITETPVEEDPLPPDEPETGDLPKTGDDANLLLWAALALAGMYGLMALSRGRKRA